METQITLKDLNLLVKETLSLSFPEQLWVIAEIGELKVNRTGHCYLELVEKDELNDQIVARSRATIWSWQYRFIQPYFEASTGKALSAGIKVLLAVSVEFHEVYGMSLNVKDIDPAYTLGDMARKRQEVINRLMEEGVFEMNKDLPLAEIPSRIAVISSPTAAGYEDFINQLNNNQAGYRFYTRLFAASMQGNDAVPSIIDALENIYVYADFFDAVVLIRGGGSQMDLSCFDDYDLAFHLSQFPIPVLTGIGHEKDESIADMVAHTRLKTPTAVAEFLIEKFDRAAGTIDQLQQRFFSEVEQLMNYESQRLTHALQLFRPLIRSRLERTAGKLQQMAGTVKPLVNDVIDQQQFKLLQLADHTKTGTRAMIKEHAVALQQLSSGMAYASKLKTSRENQLLEEKQIQLKRLSINKMEKETKRLEWMEKNKQLIDPSNILKRGFSITLKDGKSIRASNVLNEGDLIETILFDGKIYSEVQGKTKNNKQ
ncbi:exodeoxyribonuclease VII large subunit [Roseimarinus sediminis]|uniref:exodeoxyribonuclease VII large subunit n=1 Tax=Roseimarinus sediminis TaxID=1610899 RepID=UPI003D207705